MLDVEPVYDDSDTVTGSAILSLDDLRTLVGAPAPETYDDTSEAYWKQSSPPGSERSS